MGGVLDVEQVVEAFDKQIIDDATKLGRIKPAFFSLRVFPVLDNRHYRSVSRRSADSLLFKSLYQSRFGIAGRRLGEVLLVGQTVERQSLALLDQRKFSALLIILVILFVLTLFIDGQEPVELDDRTCCAEEIARARVDINRRL